MNRNFKYVVLGIIVSLSIVFIWQLYWLRGLYHTIKSETEQTVIECINTANLEEIQFRMDSLDNKPKEGKTITITQTLSDDDDDNTKKNTEKKGIKKTKKVVNQQNDTTTTVTKEEGNNALTIQQLQKIAFSFTEAIHQAIDTVVPVNLNKIDSILVYNFNAKGIRSDIYSIEIIDLNTDSIKHRLVNTPAALARSEFYNFKFDTENNTAYRIHIEPLTKTILIQMSGILGTTLLIILILCFAFWYLIRTVIQQRTLEEMKDDFTNNMTHELKTPIAVAYSAADALLNFKQGDDKEKRTRYLTICKDQLSELSALVEQILSMSMERRKTFVLNKEDILIEPLIQVLIEQHKLKAGKEVNFAVNISHGNLSIHADRTHINNIMSNLIDNAIKYSDGKVDITITAKENNRNCILTISDNGMGIVPEKQKYIFEKFYRVTSGNQYTVKGYGLGLFYVKTMVEKHHGTISVESTPGAGSTFTIIIPTQL